MKKVVAATFFAAAAASLTWGTAGAGEQGAASGGQFYVAADGRDSNSGTRDEPFATLERARGRAAAAVGEAA
jgi:hypothetical protein